MAKVPFFVIFISFSWFILLFLSIVKFQVCKKNPNLLIRAFWVIFGLSVYFIFLNVKLHFFEIKIEKIPQSAAR